MKVGIFIFDDVEELDFVGPWEVLSGVNKMAPGRLQMMTVGTGSPIRAFNGLRVLPDVLIGDCPQLDILLVPGGAGQRQQQHNEQTLDFIRGQYPGLRYLTSVCTGSFILAEAGLLAGKVTTTHRSALEELAAQYEDITVLRERLTRADNIICAAGVSAGMDLALYLIEEIYDVQTARDVATRIEYDHAHPEPATS